MASFPCQRMDRLLVPVIASCCRLAELYARSTKCQEPLRWICISNYLPAFIIVAGTHLEKLSMCPHKEP
jgi:hypothetical protein